MKNNAWLIFLLLGAACAEPEQAQNCVPNSTQQCHCSGETMGSQECVGGQGWSKCKCAEDGGLADAVVDPSDAGQADGPSGDSYYRGDIRSPDIRRPDNWIAPDTRRDDAAPLLQQSELCVNDTDCESGLCWQTFVLENSSCTTSCTVDSDCTAGDGHYSCLQVASGGICVRTCDGNNTCATDYTCIPNIDVGDDVFDFCLDMRGKLCASQADCPNGSCTFLSSGLDVFGYCNTDSDRGLVMPGEACDPNLETGVPCNTSSNCGTGLSCLGEVGDKTCEAAPADSCSTFCLSTGQCSGPCEADTDCPAGMVCSGNATWMGNNTDDPADDFKVVLTFCSPSMGSRDACNSNSECTNGEICTGHFDINGDFATVCQTATGGLAMGANCADNPATLDVLEPTERCDSDICTFNRCSAVCETAADCGSGDWQCADIGSTDAPYRVCAAGAACTKDSDCSGGQVCIGSITMDGTVGRCDAARGDITLGGSCDPFVWIKDSLTCVDATDCADLGSTWICDAEHRCHPPRAESCAQGFDTCTVDSKCSMVCATDGDCGDTAQWYCGGQPVTIDEKETGTPTDDIEARLTMCLPFGGTRAACTRDADCSNNEVCRPFYPLVGDPVLKCGTAIAGGVDPGAACGFVVGSGGNPDAYTQCKNDLCDFNDGDGDHYTGTCGAACTGTADCSNGLECAEYPLTPSHGVGVDVCRTAEAGGIAG